MAESVAGSERLRHLLLALAVGILGLIVGGVLSVAALLVLQAAGVQIGPAVILVVSLLFTQGVGMGVVALAYIRYRGLPWEFVPARVPSLRGWLWAGGGYVLAIAALVVGATIVFIGADAPEAQNQAVELAIQAPSVLLLMIPGSFLLIGPGEELLFRGIVQGTLREAFGPIAAIGLASAFFAVIHVAALTGSPTGQLAAVSVLFFPSLVLGIAYERTGNIVVPALIHGAYNATLFSLLYVSIQYGGSP